MYSKTTKVLRIATVIMILLTVISAFYVRSQYKVFNLGSEATGASKPLQNGGSAVIEVSNHMKMVMSDFTIPLHFESEDGVSEGNITLTITDSRGKVAGLTTVSGDKLDLDHNMKVSIDDAGKVSGNFTIVIETDGFAEDNLPSLYTTRSRDRFDAYTLKSSLSIDGEAVEGYYPYVMIGSTFEAPMYLRSMLILTALLIIAQLILAFKKRVIDSPDVSDGMKCRIVSFAVFGSYLMADLWLTRYEEICDWMGPWYVLDYGVGFGSRFFLGSVMKVLCYNDFLDKSVAYAFVMAVLSILVILMAYVMACVISKAKDDERAGVIMIILLYLASPASVDYMWTSANMGRLEMYLFVFVLIALIVNIKVKNIVIRYALLTLISCCMFAIHQAALFTYFAIIYMICVCNVFCRDRVAVKELAGSLVVGLSSAVLFLYFHFFSHLYIKFDNVDDMVNYVGSRTNLLNNARGIYLEYFSEAMGIDFNCYELDKYRVGGLVTTFLLWPLVVTALALSVNAWRRSKRDGVRMFLTPYPYLTLFNLLYIPLFLFENDWGRWFGAVITAKTIEFLYLYYIGDDGTVYAVGKVGAFVKRWIWIAAVVLLYLASFEKFASALFPESVVNVYSFLFPYLQNY